MSQVTRASCHKMIAWRFKNKFYKNAIKLAMLYKIKCCEIKQILITRMRVVEMRIFRWMCGIIHKNDYMR